MSESIRNADSSAEGSPPILGAEPRVLILGSLPSRKSLDQQQYYGHPQNAFWKIMRTLLGARGSYDERSAAIAAAGVAVWDVLARAVRPAHTPLDGDVVFATASAEHSVDGDNPFARAAAVAAIGAAAGDCLARAIARAVYEARR